MASASEMLELNGQTGSGGGEGPRPDAPRTRRINMNHYANKKSAAESMLDVALLMANASQLKAVMDQGPSFSFYIPLIVLISISLILQIGVGMLLIFLDMTLMTLQNMPGWISSITLQLDWCSL
ncbi:ninjurin-1 isoform X2 [Malaclemys terrapin pileata]|uniref:ninjurin-1 isoform X2 n=1 Tax=Malaclemys terrapin pileata TaxID=2991368 RepID=UPI0023A8B370|nr:ninjurin-1 isoform X2 [Malaclemys terrapin pileata]